MARVAALYRYSLKGFAPERCDALSVLAEGRIAGDRVFRFRFANSAVADDGWSTKHKFVALLNTPGLARLAFRYHPGTRRLRIATGRSVLADETPSKEGRRRIAEAVQRFVLELSENPPSSFPDRLPLRLVGDGSTPRYQDSEAGQVTLHGRASLAAVATHANPQTGERDLPVLKVLKSICAANAPTLAVAMTTEGPGGIIRVGDEIRLLAE